MFLTALVATFASSLMFTFVAFLIFSFVEQAEPVCQLGSLGQNWLNEQRASQAIQNLLEEIEINEIFESLAAEGWRERAEEFAAAPIFNGGGYEVEMPVEEFESLIWAVTLPDYAALASELLSKPKPQRGKGGRFVKKANLPDLTFETPNPVPPIAPGFSFFKALYQPTINILIHITQQFNNTYFLPTQ